MNRRAFLGSLAALTAGMALDPERLLWRPGAKTIFLPSAKPPTLVTTAALQAGDIFTIEGYFAKSPLTGAALPFLQHFIVTEDVVLEESSGVIPVEMVWPSLMLEGPATAAPLTSPGLWARLNPKR